MRVECAGISGDHQGGVSRVHQANAVSDLAMYREGLTQAQWLLPVCCTGGGLNIAVKGDCSSNPHSEATLSSLSFYVSGASSIAVCLQEPRVPGSKLFCV